MNGILPLFKPKGMTSHDCVAKLRRMLKTKKIGHTGTLDPDVCGVLPICIGKATKIVQFLLESSKTYEAEVKIGVSTTTEDASGDVIEAAPIKGILDESLIIKTLKEFEGPLLQIPPMYSAVKVKGKKLYEYAREGLEVERPARTVYIHSITLLDKHVTLSAEKNTFRFKVRCSKGTYVRTLAVDIGKKLGYPAHMSDLLRTEAGSITLQECLTFEEIEEKLDSNSLELIPLEKALGFMPTFLMDEELKAKVLNGAVIPIPAGYEKEEYISMVNDQNQCMAIYQIHPSKAGLIKPIKVFHS